MPSEHWNAVKILVTVHANGPENRFLRPVAFRPYFAGACAYRFASTLAASSAGMAS